MDKDKSIPKKPDSDQKPDEQTQIDAKMHDLTKGTEVVQVTIDKLKSLIKNVQEESREEEEMKSKWSTPAGIFITICGILLTADFKPALGFPKDTWRFLFTSVCLAALSRLVWLLGKHLFNKSSRNDDNILDRLKKL